MLKTFLAVLRREAENGNSFDAATRRRHPRRETDRCITMIGSKMYPVQDWSFGGVRIMGDGRMFATDQEVPLTIKFKLRDEVIDVEQRARVVRKNRDAIAFEFMPVPRGTKDKFQKVVDDYVSAQFAGSQMA